MAMIKRKTLTVTDRIVRILTNEYFILSVILAIAAFLRFYSLNSKSLWYDEACSLNLAAYNWHDTFLSSNVITHIPRPFYFIVLKLWAGLFGWTEIAGRSLSVILGILSVFLIYKLAKKLFGSSVGLISAFLLAISLYNIYYSQQIRYYTLFLCLSLLSLILFLRVIKDSRFKLRVLYVLVNILILYTFPLGIYIIILENIFFLIFRNRMKSRWQWLKMQIIILVAFLPVVLAHVVYITQFKGKYANETFTAQKPVFGSLIEAFESFGYGGYRLAHAGVGFAIDPTRLVIPRILTILLCFLFALSIFHRKKEGPGDKDILNRKDKVLMLWLWLFLPLLGFYLFSIWIKPIYMTRYFFALAPAFYIGIGYSISRMKIIKPSAILAISLLVIFSLDILYNPGSGNDWRTLAAEIKPRIQANDVIVLAPIMQIIPFWYYYKYGQARGFNNNIDNYGEKFYHMKNCRINYGSNMIIGFGLKDEKDYISGTLAPLLNTGNDIWLIISPDWAGKEYSEFIEGALGTSRKVTYRKYFDYDGVEAICYSPL